MTASRKVTPQEVLDYAYEAVKGARLSVNGRVRLFGIPNSGAAAAFAFALAFQREYPTTECEIVDTLEQATVLVDDVFDTGETAKRYIQKSGAPLLVLFGSDKAQMLRDVYVGARLVPGEYVVFPWEGEVGGPEDAVRRLIQFMGRNPDEPQLKDTPRRVIALYQELLDARSKDITATTFESSVEDLVVVQDLPLFSLCEHHLILYSGTCDIGYVPHGKILGLSKFARVVGRCAAGLTVQEVLTESIANEIAAMTGSQDVAVVTTATHGCMQLRGPRSYGSSTRASVMLGAFRNEPELRQEFLSLAKSRTR